MSDSVQTSTRNIIKRWTEFGHTFEIEKLPEPILKGAGYRHYRLYDNGYPANGGQWHYSVEDAEARAEYVLLCEYASRIRWLEERVNTLQSRIARLQHPEDFPLNAS